MSMILPFICGLLLTAFVVSLVAWVKTRKRFRELEEEYNKLKSHPCLSAEFMRPLIRIFVRKRYRARLDQERKGRAAAIAKYNVAPHHISFRDPFPFSLFEDFDNSMTPYLLPDGVGIAHDGLPILGNTYTEYIYGKYTVFKADGDSVFHEYSNCSKTRELRPVNIMSVIQTGKLCPHCEHHIKNLPTSPPAWYRNFVIFSNDLDIDWSDDQEE